MIAKSSDIDFFKSLPGSRPPVYRVLPYLLFRLGLVHHRLYPPSLILALRVLIPLLTGLSQFLSVRRIVYLRFPRGTNIRRCNRLRETRWPASKEEILEEMIAK
jgi:hypothetical protein